MKSIKHLGLVVLILLATNIVYAEPLNEMVASQEEVTNDVGDGRIWNLQDADVLTVINEVSQDTGKNFVIDPRVNGKITLVSSKPLKKGEVYPVFLSVLSLLGYSAIENGDVVKIVPNMESSELATRLASPRSPGVGDEVVVRVVRLTNISASQLIPVIRPLLPQWSNVSAYNPGNVLILLGRANNLQRILDIIREVDVASNSNIQIVPVKHASASQIASVLSNLQNGARSSGEPSNVSVAVDDRTNSILLGGPRAQRLKLRVLISQLDAKASDTSGNTQVMYLRYLIAKDFAPVLSRIAENMAGKKVSASRSSPSLPQSSTGKTTSSSSSKSSSAGPTTLIQAEPNSNAIIITAEPSQMKALKSIVNKLDIRPAQVLVEAIIAELDESDLTNFGIQWGTIGSSGNAPVTNGTPTSFPDFGAGVVGVIPYVKIQAILSVLRNQNGVNILSTPTLMVLDNQKATIEVGEDVPVTTGSYATTNGTPSPTPFTTNDYKKVTLKLDVTPQINLASSVRLKIDLKNDTLVNPTNPTLTPRINTSTISNSVIVNSEDVLVLGGLISNNSNLNVNKVPILSSIPVIGNLFVQQSSSQSKKKLVVFIKPVIVHNSEDGSRITEEKYAFIRRAQANFTDEVEEIGDEPIHNRLPPLANEKDIPSPFEDD